MPVMIAAVIRHLSAGTLAACAAAGTAVATALATTVAALLKARARASSPVLKYLARAAELFRGVVERGFVTMGTIRRADWDRLNTEFEYEVIPLIRDNALQRLSRSLLDTVRKVCRSAIRRWSRFGSGRRHDELSQYEASREGLELCRAISETIVRLNPLVAKLT